MQQQNANKSEAHIALINSVANMLDRKYRMWSTLHQELFHSPRALFDTSVADTVFEPIAEALLHREVGGTFETIDAVITQLGVLKLHPYDGWAMEHAKTTLIEKIAGRHHGHCMAGWEIARELRRLLPDSVAEAA